MPDPIATQRHQAFMKLDAAIMALAELTGKDPLEAMADARAQWELEERIEPFDFLGGFVNGVERKLPTVGHLEDGRGLFYTGKINTLFGDDAAGKSLMTDAVAIQEVQAGNGVIILECEEHDPSSRQERWIEMSGNRTLVTEEQVRRLTVYPITKQIAPNMLKAFIDRVEQQNVTLIVIDSLADLMGKYGLEENSNSDVRKIENSLLKPLAATGAAVVVIDHVGKDTDGKHARGSSAKRHLVSGVAYHLENPEGYEFSRETAGFSVLTVRKDRLGNYPRHKELGIMRVTPAKLNRGVLSVELYNDPSRDLDVAHGEPPVTREPTDDELISELVKLAEDMPVTAKFAVTALRLPTKKRAEELLKMATARSRLMYSKQYGGYIPTPTSHVTSQ